MKLPETPETLPAFLAEVNYLLLKMTERLACACPPRCLPMAFISLRTSMRWSRRSSAVISQAAACGPSARANGIRLKRFSDLDLAVGGSLTLKAHGLLADDFDESPLPIKVDVLALDQIDAVFRERIARDFILIRV